MLFALADLHLFKTDAQPYSPEPMTKEEVHELEEEPGSFSPELLHGDENEEAIDPEVDRVELVSYLSDMAFDTFA